MSIDTKKLERAVATAWKDTAHLMGGEFTKAITTPDWVWPRGDSPRDIVDTGRLRSSQQTKAEGDKVTYLWPVEYALIAHNGATLRNGTQLPARPWTVKAFQRKNPFELFSKLMQVNL